MFNIIYSLGFYLPDPRPYLKKQERDFTYFFFSCFVGLFFAMAVISRVFKDFEASLKWILTSGALALSLLDISDTRECMPEYLKATKL